MRLDVRGSVLRAREEHLDLVEDVLPDRLPHLRPHDEVRIPPDAVGYLHMSLSPLLEDEVVEPERLQMLVHEIAYH